MSADTGLDIQIRQQALAAGFDVVRITSSGFDAKHGKNLDRFLDAGFHGDMEWMKTRQQYRSSPQALWPQAESVIMLGLNYGAETDLLAGLDDKTKGVISLFARRKDYHDIIKKKLKAVARWLHGVTGEEVKVFVDTAPVMEKPLAMNAGIGWQGRHSCIVSREFGSWLFLGEIFTSAVLQADAPGIFSCGKCTSCLDICPTGALVASQRIDARRCISYLNIEFKGHIDIAFRRAMGNRIFGCDDCLAICPWNKFAKTCRTRTMALRPQLENLKLRDLAALDDAAFRTLFAGTPVKRTGRDRFIRNVLIAIGNSGDAELAKSAIKLLGDASPLVRAMAVWAIAELLPADRVKKYAVEHRRHEMDKYVLAEWKGIFEMTQHRPSP